MQILRQSKISDYWKQSMFERHSELSRVMYRDDSQHISLLFYRFYNHEMHQKIRCGIVACYQSILCRTVYVLQLLAVLVIA